MTFNWANALTFSRIILIAPITYTVLSRHTAWAITLFIIAAITDFFDGKVARWQKTASAFGARLDSGADMLFSIMIFYWLWTLYPKNRVFLYPIILIIVVSYLLTGIISIIRKGRIVALHTQIGRIGTFLLFTAFPVILVFGHYISILSIAALVVIIGRIETIWTILKD